MLVMMPKQLPYLTMCAFVALWIVHAALSVIEPFSHVGTLSAYGAIVCALFGGGIAMRSDGGECTNAHIGMWMGGRLMRRFSNISWEWARIGVRSVGFFVGAAGVLIVLSIQRVWVSPFSVIFIPVAVAIFALHAFRALADRNENVTLAGGWIAVCVALWIAGVGLLGGLIALPGVQAEGAQLPAYDLCKSIGGWNV